MQHFGHLAGCAWYAAKDVLKCMPESIFNKYIKVPVVNQRQYQPDKTDARLPEWLRQFRNREECGRLPTHDCWALGAWVNHEFGEEDWYLSCVYCSVYRAVEEFLATGPPEWCRMMEVEAEVSH